MATSVTLKPNAIDISGSTSGTTTLQASAVAGTTTLTLPAATDTLVGKATTDTLTNKTLTGAAMNGTLGATTPSTASVTTLTTSSTVTHSGGTANGVAYLDGSKVLTTGSALTFDGSSLVGTGKFQSQVLRVKDASYSELYFSTADTGGNGAISYNHSANAMAFYANGSEQMRLTSTGLGVGTTSPTAKVHSAISSTTLPSIIASNANDYDQFQIRQPTRGGNFGWSCSGTVSENYAVIDRQRSNQVLEIHGTTNHIWNISNAEAARIDSSGNLLVGTTSTDSGAKTRVVYGSGANGLQLKDSADTSNTAFVIFQNGSNSNIGTISRVGTTNVVAYNTTSDSRLKDDLGVATTDSVIDSLVIHDFTWKTDGTADRGVFAQEAALVKPLAVREGSDEVDENGVPKNPWGVDYSKFVPDLIVYSQQLKKQVQKLETRLAALEQA